MSNGQVHLRLAEFQKYVADKEPEALQLDFKACDALRTPPPGSHRTTTRTKDVKQEISKDVSAFLNSAGGTIIYGILEKGSHAESLDPQPLTQGDYVPEAIVQIIRSRIHPSPTVDAYSIPASPPAEPTSKWYLVVEIPQGQQAYMASDHIFYKRVGTITAPMEQYEVADAMNRTRGPALSVRIAPGSFTAHSLETHASYLTLHVAITSTNFVACEYGALRLTTLHPFQVDHSKMRAGFGAARFEHVPWEFPGQEGVWKAQTMEVTWQRETGGVILPGHWYDFNGRTFPVMVPDASFSDNPTYLIRAELYSNNPPKEALFAVVGHALGTEMSFEVLDATLANPEEMVDAALRTSVAASGWVQRFKK
jgi:hypothetical protein